MQHHLNSISLRETLHFLGWHGEPLDPSLTRQIEEHTKEALQILQPRVTWRRFAIKQTGILDATTFHPVGQDVVSMLSGCREAILLAATLGAESERLLLRAQAKGASNALMMDAVLSAAIEIVCDQIETELRKKLQIEGCFLTSRFSPGYGDMPLSQSREICEVLNVQREIGLTVSSSGIMIPRKSVTAIMGICRTPVQLREEGCAICSARDTCALRNREGGK